MRATNGHCGTGRKPILLVLGWMVAAFIVGVALLGPSLTPRRVPALVEMRHAVLMIDREFERWPTQGDIWRYIGSGNHDLGGGL
jgi:hypothetical protein